MTKQRIDLAEAIAASTPDTRVRRNLAAVYDAYKPAEREQHEQVLRQKQIDPAGYAKLSRHARSGAESYATHRDAWKEING